MGTTGGASAGSSACKSGEDTATATRARHVDCSLRVRCRAHGPVQSALRFKNVQKSVAASGRESGQHSH
jgi:hypothetical protein